MNDLAVVLISTVIIVLVAVSWALELVRLRRYQDMSDVVDGIGRRVDRIEGKGADDEEV